MRTKIYAVALAAAAFGVAAAWAEDAVPGAAARQACAPDVKTFCSGVQPGGGRIIACLRDNAAKLSAPCQQALQAAKAAHPG